MGKTYRRLNVHITPKVIERCRQPSEIQKDLHKYFLDVGTFRVVRPYLETESGDTRKKEFKYTSKRRRPKHKFNTFTAIEDLVDNAYKRRRLAWVRMSPQWHKELRYGPR